MTAAGDTPIEPSAGLSAKLYDQLSWFGHNRRRAITDFVETSQLTMVAGPHVDAAAWAEYVSFGGQVIEETLLSVGQALSRFVGVRYLSDRQMPLQNAIRAMRVDAPLGRP